MIYLGSIMFFRWEKYRFVLVMISFLAFYFSTIIAVTVSFRGISETTRYRIEAQKTA
jgi:hypothetical protein